MRSAQTACRTHPDAEWFIPWFNSTHYQKLYSHRDEAEAARFIDALIDRLHLNAGATVSIWRVEPDATRGSWPRTGVMSWASICRPKVSARQRRAKTGTCGSAART